MSDPEPIPNGMHQARATALGALATLESAFVAFNVYDDKSGGWTVLGLISILAMIAALSSIGVGYWGVIDRRNELTSFDRGHCAIRGSLLLGALSVLSLLASFAIPTPWPRYDLAVNDWLGMSASQTKAPKFETLSLGNGEVVRSDLQSGAMIRCVHEKCETLMPPTIQ